MSQNSWVGLKMDVAQVTTEDGLVSNLPLNFIISHNGQKCRKLVRIEYSPFVAKNTSKAAMLQEFIQLISSFDFVPLWQIVNSLEVLV